MSKLILAPISLFCNVRTPTVKINQHFHSFLEPLNMLLAIHVVSIMLILLGTFCRYVYSRDELYRLHPNTTSTSQFCPTSNYMHRRMAYRGCRAGKRVKDKRNNSLSNIPTVVPHHPSSNANERYMTMRNQSTNLSRSLISVKIEDSYCS